MVMDEGGSSTNAIWTGSIPYRPDGIDVEYYIVATSSNNEMARMPLEGSYQMSWITCYEISVTKAANPTNCSQGGEVTFALNVTNIGRNRLPHVSVEDLLPERMSYVSSSAGSTNDGQIVRWADIGALEVGENKELQIIARIDGPISYIETLTNQANVTAETDLVGNITANDTADIQAEEARISVIKTADPTFGSSGTEITFTLEVSNFGSVLLPYVFISDLLPTGMIYVSSSDGGVNDGRYINWSNVGPLAPGNSTYLIVDAYVNESASKVLENTVDVTAQPACGDNITAQSTESIIANPKWDFVVTKTALNKSAQQGDNVTFIFNVTNTGDLALNQVRVVDVLPVGLVYVSDNSTPSGVISGNLITWDNVGPLSAGASKFIELIAKVIL
jgi:uncharacterized repeat protein (TIGR01451 family)